MAIIKNVKIDSEFITLGQFLKFADLVFSGGEVRYFISENKISVNNEPEEKRGRKLYKNDLISVNGQQYRIC